MKRVALSEVKDDLSRYVDLAAEREIIITRHGRPAAVMIGFKDEDDWFDYRLENDPRFLQRIAQAREDVRAGRTVTSDQLRNGLAARSRNPVADQRPGKAKSSSKKRRSA